MDEVEIAQNIEDAGFVAKRRNMHYDVLGDPLYRQQDIPRMLELAVAREDGTSGSGAEAERYPARSRREKLRRGEAGADS
jgi:hypothetical protein